MQGPPAAAPAGRCTQLPSSVAQAGLKEATGGVVAPAADNRRCPSLPTPTLQDPRRAVGGRRLPPSHNPPPPIHWRAPLSSPMHAGRRSPPPPPPPAASYLTEPPPPRSDAPTAAAAGAPPPASGAVAIGRTPSPRARLPPFFHARRLLLLPTSASPLAAGAGQSGRGAAPCRAWWWR